MIACTKGRVRRRIRRHSSSRSHEPFLGVDLTLIVCPLIAGRQDCEGLTPDHPFSFTQSPPGPGSWQCLVLFSTLLPPAVPHLYDFLQDVSAFGKLALVDETPRNFLSRGNHLALFSSLIENELEELSGCGPVACCLQDLGPSETSFGISGLGFNDAGEQTSSARMMLWREVWHQCNAQSSLERHANTDN